MLLAKVNQIYLFKNFIRGCLIIFFTAKTVETTEDFRSKFASKSINFAKGKGLGEDSYSKSTTENNGDASRKPKDSQSSNPDFDDRQYSSSQKSREERLRDWEKQREQKGQEYDHRKDIEDKKLDEGEKKKEEFKRKDERDDRRGDKRDLEDRYRDRDSDRDRKKETDRYRDDRDRKRSPDRLVEII